MRDPNCRKCSLWSSAVTVCVWGDGPKDAKVMFIGEAPGEAESRTGKPFMGKSGQILRTEIANAGIDSHYITNIVKCRPPDNRTPTNEEIKACRPYLDEELATIKPEYVVTLGSPASKSVLKRAKITQSHGEIIETGPFVGMPVYHPAYVLRDPSKLPAFQQDIARLGRTIKDTRREDAIEWSLVGRDNLDQFFEGFEACEEFSFDLETSGLFPYDGKGFVRCIGLAFDDAGWVIPLNMPGSPFRNPQAQKQLVPLLFEVAKGKRAIAHNGKFDNHWLLTYYGGRFELAFDTMLAHHMLDENTPHGLKELVRAHFDAPEYDLTTKEKQGDVEPKKLYEYCARDCVYTLRLKQIFDLELRKDPALRKLFYRLTMRAARALEDAEMEGLVIDVGKMDKVEIETRAKLVKYEAELNSMIDSPINWNSPGQVAKVLFHDLGLTPVELTDKGQPSTGEATLLELKDQHPVANKLVQYREAQKFLSTYLVGWKEFMVSDRLFLGYKIHGTVTGRYSSRLHQVPRDGTIRNLVIAEPGWEFVQLDLSQAELRIAAILSRDPELIRCYAEGIDVHWRTLLAAIESGSSGDYVKPAIETAQKLTGKKLAAGQALMELLEAGPDRCTELWSGWKEARKKAKGINFGFLYSMRERKFMDYAYQKYGFKPTFREAQQYRQSFFRLYSRLEAWHDKQRKLTHLNGYVRNLAGRIRRLPGVHSSDRELRGEAERQGINSPVQGMIGDLKGMAMVEIHERMPRQFVKIVGEHHDAILAKFRSDKLKLYLPKVMRIMEHPTLLDELHIDLPVRIEVEATVGPWGAGKKMIL